MTFDVFIDTVQRELKCLKKKGYSFQELERNIYYHRNESTQGFRIRFNFTIYGDIFHIKGIVADKRFNEVEELVNRGKVVNAEANYTIYTLPEESRIPDNLPFTKTSNNFHFEVSKNSDLNSFLYLVEDFFENTALPFFEANKSLQDVALKLENLPEEALSAYLGNAGNTGFLRLYIIKHLAGLNSEDYYISILEKLEKIKGNRSIDSIIKDLSSARNEFLIG